tara:strand:- start:7810 stop:8091 length:282 start_codon:yes stop_codon:yes gene_type:complete
MSSNLTNLVSEESEVIELKTISIEDIRNRLIAIGINNTVSSYSAEDKQLSLDFLASSLSNISGVWQNLSESAKVKVVSLHEEELFEWISSYAK